ncbi:pyruvate dehydrogenase E2 component (dihydrolipoamide acetyltransferase) [Streptosporangium album]|uniref:Dihydrolipoamide acetyltransferase component of pyruvate dehydrogenase complex n=1 Tax=Streptosporangium album TaxID=47479 RepID=A0A7W7RSG6_9ACTN|nr:2-oxo acid dehydrogenase subunit E2 [Streptosporangium album]MBB4937072.1 pyruvate dehydrogenase E2 component (dihydrolipoamide acetyltransferase) [Streptosporangium album]
MARILRMPEVAANAAEAVLQGWSVTENSPFAASDVIATIETEKAVVDVEAEADGVIVKTLVPEGAAVEVGDPIAVIGDPGEKVDNLDALLADMGVAAAEAVKDPERREAPDAARTAEQAAGGPDTGGTARSGGHAAGPRIFASPLARRLARQAGIPVEEIPGSGPNGRVVRKDVEAAAARKAAEAADREAATIPSPTPAPTNVAVRAHGPALAPAVVVADRTHTDTPHSRIRRAIAARLAESKRTAPHFYLRGTARVDKLLDLRRQLNDGGTTKISVNDLVLKAAARAHTLVPAMNVIWTQDAIRQFTSVDLAMAVATPQGLVTPVLRGADRMTVTAVTATVKDYADRAKTGRLRQDELEGGTLTVTNLGMYGTEEFAAIINPPHAAILAVGAARQEPVVEDGELKVGTTMRVTLSVDHRPVDGVVAAEWMRTFLALVENPVQILA